MEYLDLCNLKIKLREKIEEFQIGNSNIEDAIDNNEPYYTLSDIETKEEFEDYINEYINNIEESRECLERFCELLEEFRKDNLEEE